MKNPYLVIIDIQEKLFPVISNKDALLKKIEILIKGFQLFRLPIIITEQVPDKLGPTIEPIRSLLPDTDIIKKSSFSCAGDSSFISSINKFKNVDGVVLAGIETHICVYQTDKDLRGGGKHVEVPTDAVSSRDKNNHTIALERIRSNGGLLTTVEMLLFTIQGKAQGSNFKELVKLVK